MIGTVYDILLIIVLLAILVAAICVIAFFSGVLLVTEGTSIVIDEEPQHEDGRNPERVDRATNQEEES